MLDSVFNYGYNTVSVTLYTYFGDRFVAANDWSD